MTIAPMIMDARKFSTEFLKKKIQQELIKKEKNGLIPGMQEWFKTSKSIMLIINMQ